MISICFLLPVKGGGGGANSVVQEALALQRLGARVTIAVQSAFRTAFTDNYPNPGVPITFYDNVDDLSIRVGGYKVLIATVYSTVEVLKELLELNRNGGHIAAYYVQDYEPFFYEPGSQQWRDAYQSYGLIPHIRMFAKTEWLQRVVYKNHGLRVARVRPSINHDLFHPKGSPSATHGVTAMVRPTSLRRAPVRTIRILNALAKKLGDRVSIQAFGCDEGELDALGVELHPTVERLGRLRPDRVADLLGRSDLFIDASDYQAFGRTALEGMACGCVPIVPILGGADEFAIHGHNAYQIDTRSVGAVVKTAEEFLSLSEAKRLDMRVAAITKAAEYSVVGAAASELSLFIN